MTDLPVVLLAHGRQERLIDLPFPKQFLQVAGEPIVLRTIRLLSELGTAPALVVAPPRDEWKTLEQAARIRLLSMRDGVPSIAKVVSVLLSTEFKEGALFLLADVAFSCQALSAIVRSREGIAFFGKSGANSWTKKPYDETYAFRCSKVAVPLVTQAVFRETPSWKLRDLRLQLGFLHVEIPDWTDDVDTPQDLVVTLPLLDGFARAEKGHP